MKDRIFSKYTKHIKYITSWIENPTFVVYQITFNDGNNIEFKTNFNIDIFPHIEEIISEHLNKNRTKKLNRILN